ncbi:ATP-dependent sacrificial sulfur transferase LarE [Methanolacinia paynteri]|uniref:ATP-dependent sacrificial sulfur transferase LarE n=1 Tax=Methanolacinia paynteri TaxID=230356 RepID=UPI000A02B6DE|nr:ATP-dependent sacrificial sulfur transferase LarE [Methanolacinia paynteri]
MRWERSSYSIVPDIMDSFDEKIRKLKEVINSAGSLLVSYSGGVDSTVLAVAANEVLPARMSCALIDSPLVSRSEIREALELAESLSLPCSVIKSDVFEDTEFRENGRDRCYICKKKMSGLLLREAEMLGLEHVADGSNISDLAKFRPGFQASEEAGIIHPFIEAGMDKEDIRKLARIYGLPVSEKPSYSCLASRIPYGDQLEEEILGEIEASEDFISSLGVGQVRVRKHGGIARIETDPGDFGLIISNSDEISSFLKQNGFKFVTLDLDGFVSGSLD